MPVSEIERRKNHIDLIDPKHNNALLPSAKDCNRFQEKDRPSSQDSRLCLGLADLKESRKYRESTHKDEFQPDDS